MKASWKLFGGLSVFYVIMTVIYWQVGGEEVGIAGMLLSACLAGMVGFYVWFTQKRIGVTLPEDNLTAVKPVLRFAAANGIRRHTAHA